MKSDDASSDKGLPVDLCLSLPLSLCLGLSLIISRSHVLPLRLCRSHPLVLPPSLCFPCTLPPSQVTDNDSKKPVKAPGSNTMAIFSCVCYRSLPSSLPPSVPPSLRPCVYSCFLSFFLFLSHTPPPPRRPFLCVYVRDFQRVFDLHGPFEQSSGGDVQRQYAHHTRPLSGLLACHPVCLQFLAGALIHWH